MQSSYSRRNRIMTAFAGSAVAAGALLGGFAAAGAASAAPFDPAKMPSCLEQVNKDGSLNKTVAESERFKQGCKPVDIYAPGLTLAQRIAFVNTDPSSTASRTNNQDIIDHLKATFNADGTPKSGGYPVTGPN